TAAKFVAAFSLGSKLLAQDRRDYADSLWSRAQSAYDYAHIKPGVTQTVSVKSPYIYAEDNWVDDMELAEAVMYQLNGEAIDLNKAMDYARKEPITPWMIRDTANHYQYYPFINFGHVEMVKHGSEEMKDAVL